MCEIYFESIEIDVFTIIIYLKTPKIAIINNIYHGVPIEYLILRNQESRYVVKI